MKYFLTLSLFFAALTVSAQETETDTTNHPFTKVEVEASFPGGSMAWRDFLVENLKADTPIKHKAKDGKYTVIVQFIVDREGNISDIKALTKHGHGMEEEVARILKMSPKWIPAEHNGRTVKAYRKQPVTFVVSSKWDQDLQDWRIWRNLTKAWGTNTRKVTAAPISVLAKELAALNEG